MAPCFLIDENLSPQLARHLRSAHGFDAVHVNEKALNGATDEAVLAMAVAENRILITNNADDFRKLGRRTPKHPGLAVILDAGGLARQIQFGAVLATFIDAMIAAGREPRGRLFEINRAAVVREGPLP